MQVKLHMCSKVTVEKGDVVAESLSDPTVVTGLDELESRGGHGQQVAQIDVTRADGQIVRFWIKARATVRATPLSERVYSVHGLHREERLRSELRC